MEEAESRQIVFTLQDVRVAQRWEVRGGRHRVIHLLSVVMEVRSFWDFFFFPFLDLLSPFHQGAAAVASCPQDCSPEGSRLTPILLLGLEPTRSRPDRGADHDISNPEKPSGAAHSAYSIFCFKTFRMYETLPGLSQARYLSPISIKGS